jgi:DNA repair protein RadC
MKIKQIEAIYKTTKDDCFSVSSPKEVRDYCIKMLGNKPEEWFIVLNVNQKNNVMSYSVVAIGTLNETLVHPREIFRNAILSNAASIICCHNHPSGSVRPSDDDIKTTKRLEEVSKIIGISLLDHVIVGDNEFLSMKEMGYLV